MKIFSPIRAAFYAALFFFFSLIPTTLHSRYIDLDSIYIKDCSMFNDLQANRLLSYRKCGSALVSPSAVFSQWVDGDKIAFISEKGPVSIVNMYSRKEKRSVELYRFSGTTTCALLSGNRRYLFIKSVTTGRSGVPLSHFYSLGLSDSSLIKYKSSYPFLDFSVLTATENYITAAATGLSLHSPESTRKEGIAISEKEKEFLRNSESNILCLISPNRRNRLLMSGSGGYYKALIAKDGSLRNITGIIGSSAETHWLDNRVIITRTGSPGHLSAELIDAHTGTRRSLIGSSFNTGITYSPYPGIVSILDNQIIRLYYHPSGRALNTGLEGEDVFFSPDGLHFTSIISGKLYVTRLQKTVLNRSELVSMSQKQIRLYNRLLQKKKLWQNQFTGDYIQSKISSYRNFINQAD